jgi:hypothetical protein
MKEVKYHGEAILVKVESLPNTAKKKIPNSSEIDGKGFIIAESETTGNHHCVDLREGVSVFEDAGTLFIDVKEMTEVFNSKGVLGVSGHVPIDLNQGVWKIGYAQEYDPITETRRNVAD